MNKACFFKNKEFLNNAFICVFDAVKKDKNLNSSRRAIILDDISKFISIMNSQKDYWLNYSLEDNVIKFSYCKDGDKNYLLKYNRVEIKLGRYFSKFFNFEDYVIDYIVKNVTAILMPNEEFAKLVHLIKGEDIGDYYYKTNIKTCMTGPDNNSKIKMYVINPDKVSLLTIKGCNCRALVWTSDCGKKILDRIYPAGHALIPTIRKWAKENDYILRESADQYIRCYTDINLEDNNYYKITLNPTIKYPFVDTFCFAENKEDKLIISNEYNFGNIALQNQHGFYIEFFKCCVCDKKQISGESIDYVSKNGVKNKYCHNCYRKNIITCDCCYNKHLKSEAKKPSLDGNYVCLTCLKTYYNTCSCCDILYKKAKIKKIDDKCFCIDCYYKKYATCECCGKNNLLRNTDEVKVSVGIDVCNECFEFLKICDNCGENIFKGKGKEVNGKIYCNYCSRYKIKLENKNSLVKNKINCYISHEDYKEIINYISTNNNIL